MTTTRLPGTASTIRFTSLFRGERWRRAGLAVLIFQVSSMAQALEITGLSGSVTALAYSPDGKTIAAADGGHDLTLWDASSGKSLAKLTGLATSTTRVCWAPDGKTVYGTSG